MKHLWQTYITAAMLGSALSLPLTAAAGSFINGDFELPGIAAATYAPIYPGHTPVGWAAGGTADAGNYSLFYENGAFGEVGKVGPNVIGFGGNVTTGATLSQTFDTVPGQTYTVNYWVTAQQGPGVQSVRLDALGITAIVLSSVSYDILNNYPELYHWYAGTTLSFIADGTSNTIRFTDTSNAIASVSTNWALDGVTVNRDAPTPAVPEPGTYGLMLAGLGLLGYLSRREVKP